MRIRFKFEINFIIILITCFTLVILTGWFVNKKISSAVEKVNIRLSPDQRLMLMKDVNRDLLEAESKVYSFNLSKNRVYLLNFYKITNKTEKKIRKLKNYAKNDPYYATQIDYLEKLVLEKYHLMVSLLSLQNDYRVNEAMGKVIEHIDQQNFRQKSEIPSTNNEEQEAKSKKWFSIFNRKKNEENPKTEIVEKGIELNQFKKDISELKKQEGKKEILNNNIELKLIQEDKILSAKLSSLLSEMEINERKSIVEKTQQAKIAVVDAKLTIQIFSIVATILLIITSMVILRYIRKNNEYNSFLQQAKIDSDELANSKVKFISNLSHEIRTPLNAIIGFSEQLSHQQSALTEQEHQQLSIIQKSAVHLSHIVNNILDFNKLEANKTILEEIDFCPVEEIKTVIDLLQFNADEKNNQLELKISDQVPDFLIGDPVKLRQILINLISNAIKFSENDQIIITVNSSLIEKHKIMLKISVIDHGIGIEPEHLNQIFREYEQENTNISRKYGGTGLGLSISKMLVELQKGSITVSSEKGKETKFTVEIPYHLGEQIEKQEIEDHSFDFLKDKHVLIVDDENYNRKLLINILQKYHVHITEAENGHEALQCLEQNFFDYILMDMRMPILNGNETAKKIRLDKNNPNHRSVIIALTAGSVDEFGDISALDAILKKPFSEKELTDILNEEHLNHSITKNKKVELEEEINTDKAFDLASLKSLSGNNKDFFKDMIQTFIQTTEEGLTSMQQEFGNKNWKQISEIAHRISAPCRHLAAMNLYHILKKIENLNDDEPKSEMENLINLAENEALSTACFPIVR